MCLALQFAATTSHTHTCVQKQAGRDSPPHTGGTPLGKKNPTCATPSPVFNSGFAPSRRSHPRGKQAFTAFFFSSLFLTIHPCRAHAQMKILGFDFNRVVFFSFFLFYFNEGLVQVKGRAGPSPGKLTVSCVCTEFLLLLFHFLKTSVIRNYEKIQTLHGFVRFWGFTHQFIPNLFFFILSTIFFFTSQPKKYRISASSFFSSNLTQRSIHPLAAAQNAKTFDTSGRSRLQEKQRRGNPTVEKRRSHKRSYPVFFVVVNLISQRKTLASCRLFTQRRHC